MTTTTTNYGWTIPSDTDLVTNGASAMRTLGQGIDTSLVGLKGGTTGQILSKTSGTDMAFTWITNDVGDITAVTTTAPLQGGASSGAVALTVDAASTTAAGVVQLSNSTSTTSSTLAATPTAVKSAYDLADAAIAKTTLTTAGDVIYRNATVPTRLGIGTAGQVLTVNSGATAPQWSTPAGGGGMTLIASSVPSAATVINFSSISGSYKHLLLIWNGLLSSVDNTYFDVRFNNSATGAYYANWVSFVGNTGTQYQNQAGTSLMGTSAPLVEWGDGGSGYAGASWGGLWVYNYADTTYYKQIQASSKYYQPSGHMSNMSVNGAWASASAITSVDIVRLSGSGTITAQTGGIIQLWGVS